MFEQKLTIQYFGAGGPTDPQITEGNWDYVQAVKFSWKDWEIIEPYIKERAGVYFLMTEPIFHPATTILYIGESRNIKSRMYQHIKEKKRLEEEESEEKKAEEWSYAIAVCDGKGSLEKDDVQYLESALIDKGIALGYKLSNIQKPHRMGPAKADEFLKDIGRHVLLLNGPVFFDATQENRSAHESTGAPTEIKEKEEGSLELTGMEIFHRRIRKRLQDVNILSIAELTTLTYQEFCNLPGIGYETARYVKSELLKRGMMFREVQKPIISDSALMPEQYEAIIKWLTTTDEELICVRMICDRVLHLARKPSRRISNAVVEFLKQQTDAWVKHPNKNGKARCGKYGFQVCFLRKTSKDGLR